MRCYLIALVAMAALFFTCSQGTGSEVEGRQCAIEGRAVDSDGKPVAAAKVRVRPKGFCALYDTFSEFDTVTDVHGFFHFDTIPVDSYTVEINKSGTIATLQELTIGELDSFPINLPLATLAPTGTITGSINLPISDDTARPWVALYNVEYMESVSFSQDFTFTGLPEGVYRLRIIPSNISKLIVELRDITVIADSTIDVGALNFTYLQFFKGCTSYECDSTAVRSLLDETGHPDVSVASVTTTDSLHQRIVTLDLSGLSLNYVSKDIGSLTCLQSLDLRNTSLTAISEHIGYLKELRYCYLDSNDLHSIPSEIAYCCSLKVLSAASNNLYTIDARLAQLSAHTINLCNNEIETVAETSRIFPNVKFLFLDSNRIASLPAGFQKMRPLEFTIAHNRLCSTSESLLWWLNTFDSSWKSTQQCESVATE